MKSPQVVRSRKASGELMTKSPAAKSRNRKGKENMPMGLSIINSKVTKVRPVPDFGKLHKKWETQLNINKAQAKKPLTMVHEFGFCKPGSRKDHVPLKELNAKANIENKVPEKKISHHHKDHTMKLVSRKDTFQPKSFHQKQAVDLKKLTSSISPISDSILADCDRDSFGTLANIQQQFDIQFQEDKNALKSILDNTGVAYDSEKTTAVPKASAAATVRQTVGGSEFKAPLCPSMRHTQQAARRSIYYTGSQTESLSKQFVYSEFARRMASRLTMDANTPKHINEQGRFKGTNNFRVSSPAPRVIQQRNSIYVKVDYSQQNSNPIPNLSQSNEIRLPMSEKKPQRVLVKTPMRSPAMRMSKSTGKKNPGISQWKDLLGPRSPQVRVTLFKDDEDCVDENEPLAKKLDEDAVKLKEIEEVEKKLQKEIDDMETNKRNNPPVISPDSPAFNRPAPSTPSTVVRAPQRSNNNNHRAASDSSMATEIQSSPVASPRPRRKALGELNEKEISIRSSPSYRERGRSRNKHKSAPTFATCVFGQEQQKTPSKRVHFGEIPNVLKHPESPSARYHKKCVGRTSVNVVMESPKSRVSAIRSTSRYSPIRGGRSPKARDYSPTSRLQDSQASQVYSMMAELDKENDSPIRCPGNKMEKGKRVVITPSKRTVITEEETEFVVEYDSPLEQSIHNMSVEDINQTISESEAVMEGLQKEEQSLMEHSVLLEQSNLDETTGNNTTIMEQMDLIQKKQQELMSLQQALQDKLDKRKTKKHGNEKRKLMFGSRQDDNRKVTAAPGRNRGTEDVKKGNVLLAGETKKGNHSSSVSHKKQVVERNVVDVSPIVIGPTGGGFNVFLTPEKQSENDAHDYDYSPTIFPVSNNKKVGDTSMRQPLHSTAHESQYDYQLKLEGKSEIVMSPVQEEESACEVVRDGGTLSQGLLQMAQNLNATPHKNMHWKKQYLNNDSSQQSDNKDIGKLNRSGRNTYKYISMDEDDSFFKNGDTVKPPNRSGQNTYKYISIDEDSFYNNGDSIKTPNSIPKTPVWDHKTKGHSHLPIGTPRSPAFNFSAMTIHTPNRLLTTPVSERRRTPLGYSPKSLFSGSAQLLMNSPIQTPLALREAAVGSANKNNKTSPLEEISIDASPDITNNGEDLNDSLTDLCMKSQNYTSPPRIGKKSPRISETGSLSLTANLETTKHNKKSPSSFNLVQKLQPQNVQTPACNDLQQCLFSKVKVKYMDALADDEVSLYTSRLSQKRGLGFNLRCHNPVSKILVEGDEFHFVPILEPSITPPRLVPSVGSAFTASSAFSASAFRQIRV